MAALAAMMMPFLFAFRSPRKEWDTTFVIYWQILFLCNISVNSEVKIINMSTMAANTRVSCFKLGDRQGKQRRWGWHERMR